MPCVTGLCPESQLVVRPRVDRQTRTRHAGQTHNGRGERWGFRLHQSNAHNAGLTAAETCARRVSGGCAVGRISRPAVTHALGACIIHINPVVGVHRCERDSERGSSRLVDHAPRVAGAARKSLIGQRDHQPRRRRPGSHVQLAQRRCVEVSGVDVDRPGTSAAPGVGNLLRRVKVETAHVHRCVIGHGCGDSRADVQVAADRGAAGHGLGPAAAQSQNAIRLRRDGLRTRKVVIDDAGRSKAHRRVIQREIGSASHQQRRAIGHRQRPGTRSVGGGGGQVQRARRNIQIPRDTHSTSQRLRG